jgi:hypothetical protein
MDIIIVGSCRSTIFGSRWVARGYFVYGMIFGAYGYESVEWSVLYRYADDDFEVSSRGFCIVQVFMLRSNYNALKKTSLFPQ